MGWPGERPLNSPEYQTTATWNEMLAEFASLEDPASYPRRQSFLNWSQHA